MLSALVCHALFYCFPASVDVIKGNEPILTFMSRAKRFYDTKDVDAIVGYLSSPAFAIWIEWKDRERKIHQRRLDKLSYGRALLGTGQIMFAKLRGIQHYSVLFFLLFSPQMWLVLHYSNVYHRVVMGIVALVINIKATEAIFSA